MLESGMVILLFFGKMGIESALFIYERCAGRVPNRDGKDDEWL
jgi:hypothetical protein